MKIGQIIQYVWKRRRVATRLGMSFLATFFFEPFRRRPAIDRKTIIIVRNAARSRIHNHALALRAMGWQVILVARAFEYGYQRNAFDKVYMWLTYPQMLRHVRRLCAKYRVPVVIGSMQPARISMELLRKRGAWKYVIDHHDSAWAMVHFGKRDTEETRKVESWLSAEEVQAEQEGYQGADGVIARSHELRALFEDTGTTTPIIVLEDRCDPASFQTVADHGEPKDKEWSVTYAGYIMPMSADPAYWNTAQFVNHAAGFREEQVHLHLYPTPMHDKVNPEYEQEARSNPYFHMHRAVSFRKVQHELAKYDFGLICFSCSSNKFLSWAHFKYHVHAKFHTYLEAGLPIIVPECFEGEAELVVRRGLGFVIGETSSNIGNLIREKDVRKLRENVKAYREEVRVESEANDLNAFLNGIIEKTNARKPLQAAQFKNMI